MNFAVTVVTERAVAMKIGFIGAGWMSEMMSQAIIKMHEAGNTKPELYAVAARSLDRAKAFAERFGFEKAYGSYQELVGDPLVDLIYIAVPHSHHYETGKLCLESGKAVLCEKAFTANANEARQLVSLAKEKGIFLAEAIWTRYQPMRRILNETIESGVIGDVHLVYANLGKAISHKDRIRLPELAGGALLDIGVYPINFVEMVLGTPSEITATGTLNALGMDMNDCIHFRYADGKQAMIAASVTQCTDSNGMVYGTKGFIRVLNVNNPEGLEIYDKDGKLIKCISAPEKLTGYEYEIEECIRMMEDSKLESESMPLSETIQVMETMDEIRRQLGVSYPFETGDRSMK